MLRGAKTFEEQLDVVRRWTKDQQFRVGLQLLRGEIDGIDAGLRLRRHRRGRDRGARRRDDGRNGRRRTAACRAARWSSSPWAGSAGAR